MLRLSPAFAFRSWVPVPVRSRAPCGAPASENWCLPSLAGASVEALRSTARKNGLDWRVSVVRACVRPEARLEPLAVQSQLMKRRVCNVRSSHRGEAILHDVCAHHTYMAGEGSASALVRRMPEDPEESAIHQAKLGERSSLPPSQGLGPGFQ